MQSLCSFWDHSSNRLFGIPRIWSDRVPKELPCLNELREHGLEHGLANCRAEARDEGYNYHIIVQDVGERFQSFCKVRHYRSLMKEN